jgi:hypothetical protein
MNNIIKIEIIRAFQYAGCLGWLLGAIFGLSLKVTTFGIIWCFIPIIIFIVLEIIKRRIMK